MLKITELFKMLVLITIEANKNEVVSGVDTLKPNFSKSKNIKKLLKTRYLK